ncbi:Hint domain-containing protein [Pseudosulfitobacter pseudonitzschiae]|uniref:Hint domain-containing protein n=1 Tax=Pseudosulfitobacter pseudonitzschiae TaxID=1402135 RepID=UPI001AF647C3|nr:Hint domain-containing protein [Pseudosulfitobacter pseudonitzschiae]MBM1815694.1 Hint domain-containing protein [Pseudosulfitobacter pseudonitzschiae]MBM1832685.1 Hint domain-containing protein [Pseudosulfitobacter pseudonitzschiae]MBM1837553.1 Hint domain-containing protein [Pseudosulfitobacter pseudonitzschiae]MBM1842399.1 Hint domain-containing protein [Pseudosulfitobacter pseudonitzschiae]MBM1847267.1 Hint domain-containing protein [Pseudosulfitobacter pseudonitzschiae]
MAWIALLDTREGRFCANGLGLDHHDAPQCDTTDGALLTRGSLMVETRMSPDGRPQELFGFSAGHPWPRSLTFQAIPGGGISMVHSHDGTVVHGAIRRKTFARTDVLRVTYAWDTATNWARLSIEEPEQGEVLAVPIKDPRPFLVSDLRELILGQNDRVLAQDVIFAAVSTQVEPIGPMPSLDPSVMAATPHGYRPVGELQRGDTVMTEKSGVVPVLHRIDRTVPARGSFSPVRLRAPYFDLQQDIVVAPDQRLMLSGSDVEYLFNQEAVLVPARHLMNGHAAHPAPAGPVITYTQLLLPGHETLLTAGTWAESLYIGRLRRKADLLENSALRNLERATLPEHGKPAYPVLKWFEAITLTDQRAA